MALFDSSKLQSWRYSIYSCIVLVNDEAIQLDKMCVTGIELVNDYFNNTFPIFKLNLILDSDTYYKILNNKTEVKIKLRLQKYYQLYGSNKKSMYKDFINDTFVIIDDTMDISRDDDLDLQEKINKSNSDDELEMYDYPLELFLYREETSTGVKTQINNILKNVTLSSVIGYLFGVSKIKNALVSPLENNKTYEEILLPPLTINRQLLHLDAMYGFYRYGSVIFFGIDRTYILNFKGGCTAFENREKPETCIYIPKITSVQNSGIGSIESNDNRHYINWNYEEINISNRSVTKDVLSGSDVLVINTSSGTTSKSTSNTVTNGDANVAIIENEGENEWLNTTFTAQTSSNSLIISGMISDVDVEALTPNKKFSLVFEDQKLTNKYKGTYFLSKTVFKFVNTTGNGDFSILAAIELRRLHKTK